MISYLEAKVVPRESFSVDVSRVFVGMAEISSEEGSGVAHLPQYRVLSGFSKWHLGHSTFIVRFLYFAKDNN